MANAEQREYSNLIAGVKVAECATMSQTTRMNVKMTVLHQANTLVFTEDLSEQ
jgi:GTPase Era involved in 16S rRNA processing